MLNLKKWVILLWLIYYDSYNSTGYIRFCWKEWKWTVLALRGSEVYRRRLCKWSLLDRPLWIKIFILYSIWRFKSKADGPREWNWTVQKAEKCQNVLNMDHFLWPSILRNSDRSLSSPWTVHFVHTKYFEKFDHQIHHFFI